MHPVNTVLNMCASTGHESAACVSLQAVLGRPLLWLACRRHVGEVVLKHVWRALKIEVSKSPEVTLFQRYNQALTPL